MKQMDRKIAHLFSITVSQCTSLNEYIDKILATAADLELVDERATWYKVPAILQGLDTERYDAFNMAFAGATDADYDTIVNAFVTWSSRSPQSVL